MAQNIVGKQKKARFSLTRIKKIGVELLKRHPKISSILVVLYANVFSNLVTFVVNIFLAKKFGPENFGIFSLAVSVMITVNFVFNLGLSLTMVRFFNLYQKEKGRQKLLLSSLFIFRCLLILLLIVVSFPAGFLLAKWLHLGHSYQLLVSLAIISGAILTLWLFLQNFLQAHKEFSKLSRYIVGYAIFRIFCFALMYLIYTNALSITAVLASLYTIPVILITLIGIIPIVLYFFNNGFPSFKNIFKTVTDVLNYSKWVAISGISFNLILRSIQFILAIRSSKLELGFLSAGFVFTVAFSTLNMAVRTVLFPHITAFENTKDMKNHLVKVKKIFPYYLILMGVGIAILSVIQIVFLGDEYAAALPVFLVTSIALGLVIFMGLISMLLHTLMRPEVDAFVNVGRLITASILVYLLAPHFGAIGGAVGYAVPVVLGEFFMVFFVNRLINEKKQV